MARMFYIDGRVNLSDTRVRIAWLSYGADFKVSVRMCVFVCVCVCVCVCMYVGLCVCVCLCVRL